MITRMNMPSKKTLLILIPSILAVFGVIVAAGLWMTNPQRTVDKFFETVKSGNKEASMAFVSADTTQKKRENIEWFVDDWTAADTFTTTQTKNESWRSHTDKAVSALPLPAITLPTTKYLAHNYQVFVNVTFDEFEDPVIVVLQRNTSNTESFFSQIFRGWKIVQIKYQPLDDSDFQDIGASLDGGEDGTNINTNTNSGSGDETKPAENTNSSTTNTNAGLVEPDDTNSAAE